GSVRRGGGRYQGRCRGDAGGFGAGAVGPRGGRVVVCAVGRGQGAGFGGRRGGRGGCVRRLRCRGIGGGGRRGRLDARVVHVPRARAAQDQDREDDEGREHDAARARVVDLGGRAGDERRGTAHGGSRGRRRDCGCGRNRGRRRHGALDRGRVRVR